MARHVIRLDRGARRVRKQAGAQKNECKRSPSPAVVARHNSGAFCGWSDTSKVAGWTTRRSSLNLALRHAFLRTGTACGNQAQPRRKQSKIVLAGDNPDARYFLKERT